jgi:protein-L-isoaspartate(D-aspartate) O-methyltransferase
MADAADPLSDPPGDVHGDAHGDAHLAAAHAADPPVDSPADAGADRYAAARQHMVDSQVRPNKVNDPAILAAMRSVPRHRFVPESRLALAYADEDVPLGGGRALVEPMVIGRLLQLARPVAGERVLVVAAGTGYGAALLARCGCRVVALEEDPALLASARDVLTEVAPSVALASGPLAAGWAAAAPYDLILIEGSVPEIPAALAGQLRNDGGRLIAVIRAPNRPGYAVVAEVTAAGLRAQPAFDCATPILPQLMPTPAFQF